MPAQQVHRNEAIRISDLVVHSDIIVEHEFHNCEIIGPAVTVFMNRTQMSDCTWDAPNDDALFWVIRDAREQIVGAVGFDNCLFAQCHFRRIGIGVKEADLAIVRAGLADMLRPPGAEPCEESEVLMPTRSSSITIDMNNVTADGRVKVSASRVRSELQPGENVQLHDSLEDVWLAASVDSMSNDTYFFAVD